MLWRPEYWLLASLLMLAGCGFEPVYAQRDGQEDTLDHLAAIRVETPPGRSGELLGAELRDHFNPESVTADHAYVLKAGLDTQFQPFIIEADGTTARYNVILKSPFTLVRQADGATIERGVVNRQVSYNVSESDDYATFVTQSDTLRRGVIELAEDYRMRISAALRREVIP